MDSLNHVNNVVYFRWMESSRVWYLGKIGIASLSEAPVSVILAETKCVYKHPLTYPDKVSIQTRTIQLGNSSWILETQMTSAKEGLLSAVGTSVVVFYDYTNKKKVTIPADIKQSIITLENIIL